MSVLRHTGRTADGEYGGGGTYQYTAPDAGRDPGEREHVAVFWSAGRTARRHVVVLRAERHVAEEHVGDAGADTSQRDEREQQSGLAPEAAYHTDTYMYIIIISEVLKIVFTDTDYIMAVILSGMYTLYTIAGNVWLNVFCETEHFTYFILS